MNGIMENFTFAKRKIRGIDFTPAIDGKSMQLPSLQVNSKNIWCRNVRKGDKARVDEDTLEQAEENAQALHGIVRRLQREQVLL